MAKAEYLHKRHDPVMEKKRLKSFEEGVAFGEEYNFLKMLKQNEMTWKDCTSGHGRISHTPTGLYIMMETSPTTRVQHKIYNLNKLRDKVEVHKYKLEQDEFPVNTLV